MCEKIKPFSFEKLEKQLFRNKRDGQNIISYYKEKIEYLRKSNHIGTAGIYELALKSFMFFVISKKKKNVKWFKNLEEAESIVPAIYFSQIDVRWLNDYENFVINDLGNSPTSVSINTRTLRTIFNTAIEEKEIDAELYPFGKNKYQPHNVKSVKKAFTKNELSVLYNAVPQNEEQAKAKDFWFFSYSCNGMNMKDIALLKFENLRNDTLTYYRAKTINTAKTDLRPIIVHLTVFSLEVIKIYSNADTDDDNYIFPIISVSDDNETKFRKINNFIRFVNQHIKVLAKANGLTTDISTYWARHSFATNAVRMGASMEFVSEALNHHDMKTTQGYFAGFEEESKKEMAEKLMNFD